MVGRTVFQKARATSQDNEILDYNRERCWHTNPCGNYHILSHGYCPAWYEAQTLDLWSLADSHHLIDWQNLFDKTNFNDVEDLLPLIPGLFD